MSRTKEYRENAAECQRMAARAANPTDRATWLDIAASWMRMLPEEPPTDAEAFDDRERRDGTHQPRSEGEH